MPTSLHLGTGFTYSTWKSAVRDAQRFACEFPGTRYRVWRGWSSSRWVWVVAETAPPSAPATPVAAHPLGGYETRSAITDAVREALPRLPPIKRIDVADRISEYLTGSGYRLTWRSEDRTS